MSSQAVGLEEFTGPMFGHVCVHVQRCYLKSTAWTYLLESSHSLLLHFFLLLVVIVSHLPL